MKKGNFLESRRNFLKGASMAVGALLISPGDTLARTGTTLEQNESSGAPADCTLHIKTVPVEIAKNKIISLTTYNGAVSRASGAPQRRATRGD